MAMPRPEGKALKIAQEVVPFLKSQKRGRSPQRSKPEVSNDALEMKMVDINENILKPVIK